MKISLNQLFLYLSEIQFACEEVIKFANLNNVIRNINSCILTKGVISLRDCSVKELQPVISVFHFPTQATVFSNEGETAN